MKHKQNVEDFHRKKKDEKLYGARNEREIQQQLAEINKAANDAIANDKRELVGQFSFRQVSPLNHFF